MRKYVIMGIQGSGKGTHAKMLAGDLSVRPRPRQDRVLVDLRGPG